MRVKKMEDLTPYEHLFESMAFSGDWLPRYGDINITYYKRYRQADITPPIDYSCPYVERSPSGQEEHTVLVGVAAKIMLMRDIINKIGVGGQVDSGVDKNIPAEIKPMYKSKEIPKVTRISDYVEEKFTVQKLSLC